MTNLSSLARRLKSAEDKVLKSQSKTRIQVPSWLRQKIIAAYGECSTHWDIQPNGTLSKEVRAAIKAVCGPSFMPLASNGRLKIIDTGISRSPVEPINDPLKL